MAAKVKRIYLICPVAKVTPEISKKLDEYVVKLEKEGYKVHFPPRDVDQDDPTGGVEIMNAHSKAMILANEVHIWYDETSGGSKCDIGMMYILIKLGYAKKVVIVNKEEAMERDKQNKKSYFKVLMYIVARQDN